MLRRLFSGHNRRRSMDRAPCAARTAGAAEHPASVLRFPPKARRVYRRRTDLTIKRETLPLGLVGNKLYQIPYRSLFQGLLGPGEIGEWAFQQFHGFVDTTTFANGRLLVTLELFDAAENQIKPATDPGTAAGFSFQTWDQTGLSTTVRVQFGALTHLLWWDNTSTDAAILVVNKNEAPLPRKACSWTDRAIRK